MNSLQRRTGWISVVLMAPALFLSSAGLLYLGFGIDGANRLLDGMMAHALFKLLLSPVIVLGGPLLVAALNGWKVFHLSAEVINEELVIAVSVKRLSGPLVWLALATGLLLLFVLYAFVENFQIVAR